VSAPALPAGAVYDNCRGPNCGKLIMMVWTPKRRRMPLDPWPNVAGNVVLRYNDTTKRDEAHQLPKGASQEGNAAARYMPHHATCVDVKQFRKGRKGG